MSLAQELSTRPAPALAPASAVRSVSAPTVKVAAEELPVTGALGDALKTAEACRTMAAEVGAVIEKTASEGTDPQVAGLHKTLRKSAHYLGDLVDLVGAQKRAHASLLGQYEEQARMSEALKVASEMIRDGLVPVPEDFEGYVRKLASQNLEVVKAAAEMAASNSFADLGDPEPFSDKTASDASAPGGVEGSDWEQNHGFLLT
jgi:hypothetical protein